MALFTSALRDFYNHRGGTGNRRGVASGETEERRMTMNIIEASGLGKRYGSTWALHECTMAIPAGHVAALVGPNGAGKTTLLNLAVGLAEPSAGGITIVLDDRLSESSAALRRHAYVAQARRCTTTRRPTWCT